MAVNDPSSRTSQSQTLHRRFFPLLIEHGTIEPETIEPGTTKPGITRKSNPAGKARNASIPVALQGNDAGRIPAITPFVPVVFTVKVTVWTASLPLITICAGAKTQVALAGKLVQAKVAVPVIPPTGVTVRTVLPDCPCTMVSEVGLALIE